MVCNYIETSLFPYLQTDDAFQIEGARIIPFNQEAMRELLRVEWRYGELLHRAVWSYDGGPILIQELPWLTGRRNHHRIAEEYSTSNLYENPRWRGGYVIKDKRRGYLPVPLPSDTLGMVGFMEAMGGLEEAGKIDPKMIYTGDDGKEITYVMYVDPKILEAVLNEENRRIYIV